MAYGMAYLMAYLFNRFYLGFSIGMAAYLSAWLLSRLISINHTPTLIVRRACRAVGLANRRSRQFKSSMGYIKGDRPVPTPRIGTPNISHSERVENELA
nr:hypothetical protein Q903MT_gene3697 [Picea sitchensis]